ncbi:MAG: hypothetical protein EZS28_037578, partial [Streblomastix strix]
MSPNQRFQRLFTNLSTAPERFAPSPNALPIA